MTKTYMQDMTSLKLLRLWYKNVKWLNKHLDWKNELRERTTFTLRLLRDVFEEKRLAASRAQALLKERGWYV